jgi:hypothetical protein
MRNLIHDIRIPPGKSRLLWIFMLCALPLGLMIAVITPPGQSPDEAAQVARAAGLLHGAVLGVRKAGLDPDDQKPTMWGGVKVDTGLFVAAFGQMTTIDGHRVFTAQDFAALRAQPPNHVATFANLPNTATFFPAVYVPAAIGLGVGQLLRQPPYVSFLLARLCMLLVFLSLGAAALAIAAFGEAVLLTVLLMPMTMFLAGTVNQDGVLIPMTCLACAALTRGGRGFWWLALCLFVLVLGSKPPYILLLGVFLLPLRGLAFWRRVRNVALACVPLWLWIVLVVAFVAVPFDHPPYHPGPLFAGQAEVMLYHSNPLANLHILLADPVRFITIPTATIYRNGIQTLREMIGVLGLLQIMLPNPLYTLWGLSFSLSVAGLLVCARPGPELPRRPAAIAFLSVVTLIILTVWAIMIVQYMSWTLVGARHVQGFEGRYGLILLPFLILAVPWLGEDFELPAIPPLAPAGLTILLGVFDLAYIPAKLVYAFYLH